MQSRYDLNKDDLAVLLDGEASYRVDQLWQGMYVDLTEPSELTTLSKDLRNRLGSIPELQPALQPLQESVTDEGNTVKWLWGLRDGARIETVLMHYKDRSTVCVSSQAGCAMNCSFCATGQAGFERQLEVGEIVEQVVRARRCAANKPVNIVFMGMGEPLANFERLWRAIERLHDDLATGARRITVSTVGVVPGIRKLKDASLPVNLAVSLHAANDKLRDSLVPLNRRYPLDTLMQACKEYVEVTRRRLSFEWALIAGVNDRKSDALELAGLALPLGAHVNVIPLNATPGYPMQGSPRSAIEAFVEELGHAGVNVTVRDTRGSSIDAACGQLAATASHKGPGSGSGNVAPKSKVALLGSVRSS